VDGDEFGAADVKPLEDLRRGSLAEGIWYRDIPPERAKVGEDVPSPPQPIRIRCRFCQCHRSIERPPVPIEGSEADLPIAQAALELRSGSLQQARVRRRR
jgi:hypothetical protein